MDLTDFVASSQAGRQAGNAPPVRLNGFTTRMSSRQALAHEVEGVSLLVDEVAKASDQQANGIEQVNQTVSEMDNITQTGSLRSTIDALISIVRGRARHAADTSSRDETAASSATPPDRAT